MKRWAFAAVIAAGFVLAGCAGQPDVAPTSEAPAPTSAPTSAVVEAAWSDEAVTACRTFVNAVPNMRMVKSEIQNYKAGLGQETAVTGWGLATAGMVLPASVGMAAEPDVYQAMVKVREALELPLVDHENMDNDLHPAYVAGMSEAFSGAIAVCNKVGVIA